MATVDNSITQQVVLYVIYTDPETFKPSMKFLEVVAPSISQHVPGLSQAIFAIFRKNILELVLNKITFLVSNGASVNYSRNSRLIRLLQEDLPWISFIWCFNHQVKLSLKDALNNFIKTNETALQHLYYLYKKSSEKQSLKICMNYLRADSKCIVQVSCAGV